MSDSENPWNGQGEARRLLEETRTLLAQKDKRQAIDAQAKETYKFLLANEWSHPATDKHGLAPQIRIPWWPIANLGVVTTIKGKVQREDHLRWKAFDHGLVNFMYGLATRGIISGLSANDIEALLDGGTKAILYEVEDGVRLQGLTRLIGNGKGKLGAVRDGYVIPLARLRLLQDCDIPGRGSATGYGIQASYATNAFIEKVYAPIVVKMEIKYQSLLLSPPSPITDGQDDESLRLAS